MPAPCLSWALEIFDECTAESDDREACFAKAIRAFFDCVRECPPPTCEDRCADAGGKLFELCVDAGGDEDRCAKIALEAFTECEEYCEDHEAPTCEDKCGTLAERVYDACDSELDDVELCGKIERHIQGHSSEWCDLAICRRQARAKSGTRTAPRAPTAARRLRGAGGTSSSWNLSDRRVEKGKDKGVT